MQWMLWTLPTGLFFVAIAVLLIGMTVWEIFQPSVERRGWIIPMRTTRGDRLFIALLASAYICAFWVAVVAASPWWMVAITVFLIVLLLCWG
jgi:predicted small integral membrane protein